MLSTEVVVVTTVTVFTTTTTTITVNLHIVKLIITHILDNQIKEIHKSNI